MKTKFRVYDKDNNTMYKQDDLIIIFDACDTEVYFISDNGDVSQIDNYDLMQYIGIKDKNGIEIYEGDILQYTFDDETKIGVMSYNGSMFTYEGCIRWNFHSDKIIGNIYDNPELLKTNHLKLIRGGK